LGLFLIDSASARKDQVVGLVGLADIQSTLLSWPADKVTSDVNVGTISGDPDGGVVASGTLAGTQQDFSLSLDQLRTLARNSEVMRPSATITSTSMPRRGSIIQ